LNFAPANRWISFTLFYAVALRHWIVTRHNKKMIRRKMQQQQRQQQQPSD
jgi:hypothetical protein